MYELHEPRKATRVRAEVHTNQTLSALYLTSSLFCREECGLPQPRHLLPPRTASLVLQADNVANWLLTSGPRSSQIQVQSPELCLAALKATCCKNVFSLEVDSHKPKTAEYNLRFKEAGQGPSSCYASLHHAPTQQCICLFKGRPWAWPQPHSFFDGMDCQP